MRKHRSQRRGRKVVPYDTTIPASLGREFLSELLDHLETLESGFKLGYQMTEMLSKYLDKGSSLSPKERRNAAYEKFDATELRNRRTNQRLQLADDEFDFGWVTWGKLKSRIRADILRVLGPVPSDLWETGGFTNGASTRVKRSPKAAIGKLTGKAHCSPAALTHWVDATFDTCIKDLEVSCFSESVMFTVPKSSHIDRVACKEPELNMYLQRCVGNHIRRNLRRIAKINLNDQTQNQIFAANAVQHGLATIDLSSASDSISRQLVIELLPFEWWSLMDDLRVKHTWRGDDLLELEMFSSMGNGFTFELESLLFWAITKALIELSGFKSRGRLSVYGDDIIAPCAIVPRLMRIFSFLGFKVNQKKTHFRGLFRESCGRHYYGGLDVTPFYIRKPVTDLQELIRILNQFMEWSCRGVGFFTNLSSARFHYKWSVKVPSVLWGGLDAMSTSALVTGHFPRKRLTPITKEMKHNEKARLKLWLLTRRKDSQVDEFGFRESLELTPKRIVGFKLSNNRDIGAPCWSPWWILSQDH